MLSTLIFKAKKIFLITAAILLLGFLYVKLSSMFFVHAAEAYVLKQLENQSGQTIKIHSIHGGVFGKFVLNDFMLLNKTLGINKPIITVKKAVVNYSIWNFIFRTKSLPNKIRLLSPSIYLNNLKMPKINGNGTQNSSDKKNDFYLLGCMTLAVENGNIFLDKTTPIFKSVEGYINIDNKEIIFDSINCSVSGMPAVINGKIVNFNGVPRFDFQFDSRVLDTFFNINGTLDNFIVWGIINMFGRSKIYTIGEIALKDEGLVINNVSLGQQLKISGLLDFTKQKVDLNVASTNGGGKLIIDFLNKKITKTTIELEELQVGNYNITTNITLLNKIFRNKKFGKRTKNNISTSGTIINGRPFKELNGEFMLYNNNLYIKALRLGESYNISGTVNMAKPYELDLGAVLANANVSDLLVLGKTASDTPMISGAMNGRIICRGPASQLKTRVHIEGENGTIGKIKYERAILNIEGTGPILKVVDSRAYKKEGYLDIIGEFNFTRLGQETMLRDIKLIPSGKISGIDG